MPHVQMPRTTPLAGMANAPSRARDWHRATAASNDRLGRAGGLFCRCRSAALPPSGCAARSAPPQPTTAPSMQPGEPDGSGAAAGGAPGSEGAGVETAVDQEVLARDVAGLGAADEGAQLAELLGRA